ncbi:MAG: hypothetical protein ACK5L5_10535 [Bacteroidales bacterium]
MNRQHKINPDYVLERRSDCSMLDGARVLVNEAQQRYGERNKSQQSVCFEEIGARSR